MRTTGDRIRQAISFEAIGLVLIVPLIAFAFQMPLGETGILGLIGATMATLWNYVFNLGFDRALKRLTGATRKSVPMRVLHAVAFELGLLLAFLPVVMWWLGIGPLDALLMDLTFVVFYVVYAFVFTWAYDTVFPDPDDTPPSNSNNWQAESGR